MLIICKENESFFLKQEFSLIKIWLMYRKTIFGLHVSYFAKVLGSQLEHKSRVLNS